MNKSTFAENEESDLLQNLFREKQRVQELEEELERVHKTSKNALEIGSDQTLKFKQLVSILRKKYDEAQHRNNEIREKFDKFLLEHDKLKKTYDQSIQEQKQKEVLLQNNTSELHQLKEQIQNLRLENQDKEEELVSLKEQLIKLKELLLNKENTEQAGKAELETFRQKQKQFERVVHYLRKRLEEAHLEHKELLGTFQSSQQANKKLEESLKESNDLSLSLQTELQQIKAKLLESEMQENQANASRKETFDEQLKLLISTKEQLEDVKASVLQSLKEFKAEKLGSEQIHLQRIDSLEKALADLQEAKDLEVQQLSQCIEEWQNKSYEARKETEEFSSLQEELAQLSSDNQEYKERIATLEAGKEESENSLRMAQQHLAKKVRETAVIAEENEELKQHIRDLQNELDFAKLKIAEGQNALEVEFQHQKKLQEQYQDGLKSFEIHTLKWEEKYFNMQQKWQEAEDRLREFHNFEEKYQKMHSILNHLSNLLGKPIVLPAGELPHTFETLVIEKEKNLQIDQPTFFDLSSFSKEVKSFY